jgi:single-stranded-DNA-specific exonuclease
LVFQAEGLLKRSEESRWDVAGYIAEIRPGRSWARKGWIMRFPEAKRFMETIPKGSRVVLLMDGDADGLSGGKILDYTLGQLGIKTQPVFPGKTEYAYSPRVVEQVRAASPDYIVIVDMGSSPENPYAPTPVLIIDHHRPMGIPPGVVYCNSYGNRPVETSSLICYLVCEEMVVVGEAAWIPLLGVFGDLGSADAFPYLAPFVKRYGKTHCKRAVSLLNAARRAGACDVKAAYAALGVVHSPKDLVTGEHLVLEQLRAYKEEVREAIDEAARMAPVFSGDTAWIRCSSACLIQGLMASRWANRLPRYRVLASNNRYMPGEIVFSLRSQREESQITFLRKVLRDCAVEGAYGFGHDAATGGKLLPGSFAALMQRIGFDDKVVQEYLKSTE